VQRLAHVETDSFDREAFARVRAASAELSELEAEGARLLPHPGALLLDLFASLYKLNRIRHPSQEMAVSVRVHALLLDLLEETGALNVLRTHSELDIERAGLGTALLAGRLFEWLRRSGAFTEQELVDAFRAAETELERDGEAGAADEAERLSREEASGEPGRRALASEAERRRRHAAELEAELARARDAAERAVEQVPRDARRQLRRQVERAPEELEQALDQLESWELTLGKTSEGGGEAARRIDLGRRLASNPKLAKLSALVGRMSEQARGLRRARTPRRSAEVFRTEVGDDPGRLLPAELALLGHPLARLDLLRRLLEGSAGVYSLRGLDRQGKGPVVVCLDTSSSMTGEKELWSKAVVLTLLHLARRRRRPFEVIAFSGAEAPLVHFPLLARGGAVPDPGTVLALAEHFPGGGTSFEKVLSAALERVSEPGLRGRADHVLISDGESSVSPAFLERLALVRRRDELAVLTVLIDVGPSTVESVRRFSDRVVSVRQLTDESTRELFLEFE
jgi:uncharacterized protein with von Willebrand factor type A (vWA) domain